MIEQTKNMDDECEVLRDRILQLEKDIQTKTVM